MWNCLTIIAYNVLYHNEWSHQETGPKSHRYWQFWVWLSRVLKLVQDIFTTILDWEMSIIRWNNYKTWRKYVQDGGSGNATVPIQKGTPKLTDQLFRLKLLTSLKSTLLPDRSIILAPTPISRLILVHFLPDISVDKSPDMTTAFSRVVEKLGDIKTIGTSPTGIW